MEIKTCNDQNPGALARLSHSGVDAVLTIVLLDKKKGKYYVSGRVNYRPNNNYQGRFWGYYHTMYNRVYTQGYYVTNTEYFWESNFYSMDINTQLIYSAQSQSFDPPSTSSLTYEYGKMIVKDMLKSNVLIKRNSDNKQGF